MILRCGGRFYKVLKLRSSGENSYTFECKDLDTKESRVFQYKISGLLEALDRAFKIMKDPKDIFFLDIDRNGEWRIVKESQISAREV
jgi:predicted nucleic acid-binding protein